MVHEIAYVGITVWQNCGTVTLGLVVGPLTFENRAVRIVYKDSVAVALGAGELAVVNTISVLVRAVVLGCAFVVGLG